MTQQGRILVIGQSGQLAQALCRAGGSRVVAVGRERFDILSDDPHALLTHVQPLAVINASAFTNVDGAETSHEQAFALNRDAVARLGKASAALDLPLFHVSTDYVFNGLAGQPLSEDDEPQPVNTYGASKLAGEAALLDVCPDAMIVRVSWLFDRNGGSFLNAILSRLERGEPVRVVDDQISAPTYADDLARVLLELAAARPSAAGKTSGVFHFQGGSYTSWYTFACQAAQAAAAHLPSTPMISAIPSSQFPQLARRPLDTRLDASRLHRVWGIGQGDWAAGLRDVIANRY